MSSSRSKDDGGRVAPQRVTQVLLITACPVSMDGVERCFGGIQRWSQIVAKHGLPRVRLHFVNTAIWNMSRFRDASPWGGEVRRFLRILASLLRHFLREDIDLVHINCVPTPRGIAASWVYARLARLWRLPVVIHYHGDFTRVWKEPYGRQASAVLKRLARSSAGNIVLDRKSLESAERFGSRAFLLPNFVEDSILRRQNGRREESSERIRVVFVGQVRKQKGCVELLAAAGQLPDADFVLIGIVNANMSDHVREMPSNVKIVDQVPQNVVTDELRASDIFVLPSWSEGFPLAVLEAMAAGLPVVTTRVGACPDMIEGEKGGILVKRGNVAALVSALRALMDDPARRAQMGRFNHEKAGAQYAHSVVAPQLTSIYEQIASAGRVRVRRRTR